MVGVFLLAKPKDATVGYNIKGSLRARLMRVVKTSVRKFLDAIERYLW